MKLKISLDPNSIKQFSIDHVEKFLFGIVVVLFLLFVYKAVARNKLDWQPQDLVQDADQAKKRIQDTKPNPPPIRAFTDEAKGITKAIVADDYKFKTDWDPLIFGENVPRGLPATFPIKDLRASAGNGAFAMAPEYEEDEDEEMMSTTRGQRWVVLTGLIDHRKQKDAYDTAFQEAAQWDPQRDYPDYVFYRVERAEADPRVETAELKWAPVHVMNMNALQDLWLQSGTELVDPIYLPPPRGSVALAYPLGPLQNREWGPEVAHPPEIPLSEGPSSLMASSGMGGMPDMYGGMPGRKSPSKAKAGKPEREESEEEVAKRIEAEKKARAERRKKARLKLAQQPDEPDAFDTAGGGAGAGMAPGGMDPMYGGARPGGRRVRPTGMPGGMPGAMPDMAGMSSGSMMPGMPGMRGMRRRAGVDEEETTEEVQEVAHMLFRFFDFSVQPGKHYRYRVKLVLANPNFGMLPHFLERDGMEKVKTLEADWSDPSPIVSVPLDSQVLAVSAKPDGTATLMVVRFQEADGVAAAEEFATVQRGQFLNYLGRPMPETATTGMMPGMGGMGGMSPMGDMASSGGMGPMGPMYGTGVRAKRDEDAPEPKVDYITNSLLLDVTGGGRLPGRDRSIAEPASLLLMDSEGKLVVRNELDDLAEYHFHQPPEAPAVAGAAGPAASKAKGRRGSSAGNSAEDAYAAQMAGMGAMPGMAPPPKAKGAKKGGTKTGLPPGMTPGMMPGGMSTGPAMGAESLDDKASKRKKGRSR